MRTLTKKDHDDMKKCALIVSAHGYRNSIIENYHAAGKLDDDEMMALNKDVHNRIYTIMYMLTTDTMPQETVDFMMAMGSGWDEPKLVHDEI